MKKKQFKVRLHGQKVFNFTVERTKVVEVQSGQDEVCVRKEEFNYLKLAFATVCFLSPSF